MQKSISQRHFDDKNRNKVKPKYLKLGELL